MLTIDDLARISGSLNGVLGDIGPRDKTDYRKNIAILMNVGKDELSAFDKELYKNGHGGDLYGFEPGDEVDITINGVLFRLSC